MLYGRKQKTVFCFEISDEPGATAPGSLLPFQKVNVFVNGRPAQITNSCQFADVEVSALVSGVVPEKSRR